MAYRQDSSLEFFSDLISTDLDDLVEILTVDKGSDKRWTEELTKRDKFKRYNPDHVKYWEEIAAEIQCFGGNTIATMFRGGKGVLYEEILDDVCDQLKVKKNKEDSVADKENLVLLKIIEQSLHSMTEGQRMDFAKIVGINNISLFTPEALLAGAQTAFKLGGFKSYQLTLIVVNAVSKAILGRGLTFAGNAALMRSLSVWVGPIGWALTGLWTVVDIAGPAYRVTIPSVIQVAYLRKTYNSRKEKILDGILKDINEELG